MPSRGNPSGAADYSDQPPRDPREPRMSANDRINRCTNPISQEHRAPAQQNLKHWNKDPNRARALWTQTHYQRASGNEMPTPGPRREPARDLNQNYFGPSNNHAVVDTRCYQAEPRRTNQNLSWVPGSNYDVAVKRPRMKVSSEDVSQRAVRRSSNPPLPSGTSSAMPFSAGNLEGATMMEEDTVSPTDPACICLRPSMKVCCIYCGTLIYEFRVARTCIRHPTTRYLMDLSNCVQCGAPAEALREFNL